MKLPSTYLALSALLAVEPMAHAATAPQVIAGQPVLWSVHFDAQRLRSGVGQELFKTLDPILTVLSGDKATGPGGKLESFAAFGLPPQKGAEAPPILSSLHFSAEGGGISQRFEAIGKKHLVPLETLVGYPAMHFEQEGKEVWIAKFNDQQLFLSTSRALIELVLKSDAATLALPLAQVPNEILGGKVEIKSLLADHAALTKSEILKLASQLDFHLIAEGEELNLDATTEMDDERSAKRAARMIDGMVAMLSIKDTTSLPWDERLTLNRDGSRLSMHVHLEPQEAKDLFDAFTREMAKQTKNAHEDQ